MGIYFIFVIIIIQCFEVVINEDPEGFSSTDPGDIDDNAALLDQLITALTPPAKEHHNLINDISQRLSDIDHKILPILVFAREPPEYSSKKPVAQPLNALSFRPVKPVFNFPEDNNCNNNNVSTTSFQNLFKLDDNYWNKEPLNDKPVSVNSTRITNVSGNVHVKKTFEVKGSNKFDEDIDDNTKGYGVTVKDGINFEELDDVKKEVAGAVRTSCCSGLDDQTEYMKKVTCATAKAANTEYQFQESKHECNSGFFIMTLTSTEESLTHDLYCDEGEDMFTTTKPTQQCHEHHTLFDQTVHDHTKKPYFNKNEQTPQVTIIVKPTNMKTTRDKLKCNKISTACSCVTDRTKLSTKFPSRPWDVFGNGTLMLRLNIPLTINLAPVNQKSIFQYIIASVTFGFGSTIYQSNMTSCKSKDMFKLKVKVPLVICLEPCNTTSHEYVLQNIELGDFGCNRTKKPKNKFCSHHSSRKNKKTNPIIHLKNVKKFADDLKKGNLTKMPESKSFLNALTSKFKDVKTLVNMFQLSADDGNFDFLPMITIANDTASYDDNSKEKP